MQCLSLSIITAKGSLSKRRYASFIECDHGFQLICPEHTMQQWVDTCVDMKLPRFRFSKDTLNAAVMTSVPKEMKNSRVRKFDEHEPDRSDEPINHNNSPIEAITNAIL
jgi:hypothetical protein